MHIFMLFLAKNNRNNSTKNNVCKTTDKTNPNFVRAAECDGFPIAFVINNKLFLAVIIIFHIFVAKNKYIYFYATNWKRARIK